MTTIPEHGDSPHPRAGQPVTRQDGQWAVEVHGLTKWFGARSAVDNVNLLVPRGCAFGYLGPNDLGATQAETTRQFPVFMLIRQD